MHQFFTSRGGFFGLLFVTPWFLTTLWVASGMVRRLDAVRAIAATPTTLEGPDGPRILHGIARNPLPTATMLGTSAAAWTSGLWATGEHEHSFRHPSCRLDRFDGFTFEVDGVQLSLTRLLQARGRDVERIAGVNDMPFGNVSRPRAPPDQVILAHDRLDECNGSHCCVKYGKIFDELGDASAARQAGDDVDTSSRIEQLANAQQYRGSVYLEYTIPPDQPLTVRACVVHGTIVPCTDLRDRVTVGGMRTFLDESGDSRRSILFDLAWVTVVGSVLGGLFLWFADHPRSFRRIAT